MKDALQLVVVEHPAAEELDLRDAQAGVGEHTSYALYVRPDAYARQFVDVPPGPGEPGVAGRLAPLDEGTAGRLAEARAGQGKEAADQVVIAGRVSHGCSPR